MTRESFTTVPFYSQESPEHTKPKSEASPAEQAASAKGPGDGDETREPDLVGAEACSQRSLPKFVEARDGSHKSIKEFFSLSRLTTGKLKFQQCNT